ncbi:MAG: PepSY-associated TM helix domain-containing protein [Planctomycetota bacterium]|nr:PepSY-associated TM helix domain-containing protein [Planctomycetota bacterium]
MSRHPAVKWFNKWFRKWHRWGAIAIALPLLVVIASGILLQLKKDWSWVQPPTSRGVGGDPSITFDQILEAAKRVPQAEIASWDDVDRLDVRPGRGIVKVRANNRWEIQIDTRTGEPTQIAYRRSDLIESIHDGSWFHDAAKLWVFLPSGIILLALYVTGMYLWVLPIIAKRSGRKRRARLEASAG